MVSNNRPIFDEEEFVVDCPFDGEDLESETDSDPVGFCYACDMPGPLNSLGLCESCGAKLERDLIRQRDWDYSMTSFGLNEKQREDLRKKVIRKYGKKLELIAK